MKKYFLLSMLLICSLLATAQNNILQKIISVDFRNVTMYEALMQIESKAGFYFSYDNQFIKNQKKISFAASNKTVKDILDQILDKEYQYLVHNNKVVIRKKETQYMLLEGGFVDNSNQQPIEYVSVYDPVLKTGTTSDEKGRFSLKVPFSENITLFASRVSYSDTSFEMNDKTGFITIGLTSQPAVEQEVVLTSVQRHWLAKKLISTRQKVSSVNLRNYFYERKFQLNILPGIGTKNVLKSQQENQFAFNVLGGYAAQVDAFELGGLFNIVQKHTRSVQIGGLFNIVGGYMNGLQIGGLYNYVGANVTGLQIGGLVNANPASTSGLQIGGIYNTTKKFDGLQIGGLINNTQEVSKAVQIAGLINITENINNGVQISGLVNYAKKTKGLQVSVVNIADTIEGVAIGPFNYHVNGKHAFAVALQENGLVTASYKSGSYALYNIVNTGWIKSENKNYYMLGYGLGSEWYFGKKIKSAIEVIGQHYAFADGFATAYQSISLQPLFIYQPIPKVQLFAGPRLQYRLNLHHVQSDHHKQFERNMTALNSSRKNNIFLGWTIGANIF